MTNKVTVGIRIALMLVDHFAMTFIVTGIFLVTFGLAFLIETIHDDHWTLYLLMGIMVPLIFSVYINKDALNGRSPAKRILKFQILDIKNEKVASPIKCLIRNLLYPLWIIEIPFVLINPERKLGDYIAGTKIAEYNPDRESVSSTKQIILAIVLGMIYMAAIFALFINFNSDIEANVFDILN